LAGNKTEQPTPKRLRDAKRKGQIAKSTDLIGAIGLVCIMLIAPALFSKTTLQFKDYIRGIVSTTNYDPMMLVDLLQSGIEQVLVTCASMLAFVFAVVAVSLFLMIGPAYKPMEFSGRKLNLIEGMKSMFSRKRALELIKTVAKLMIGGCCAWFLLAVSIHWFVGAYIESVLHFNSALLKILERIAITFCLLCGSVGIVDFLHVRYRWKKELLMSRDEIRDEFKETEGDPLIRSLRRGLHRQLAGESIARNIRKARVVIVNPTDLAVALEYVEGLHEAPRVLLKGRSGIASIIRREAVRSGVAIVRDVRLARVLFQVPDGEEIPDVLYEIIAEIFLVHQGSDAEGMITAPLH